MSEMAQASTQQQLQMLKEQTRLTGALHEAQVLQLKMWPLVVFQNAISSEFTWDPDKKVVAFKLDLPTSGPIGKPEWWQERTDGLNGWVQTLLGDEWCITVLVSQGHYAVKYRGTRKISADAGAKRSSAD